MDRQTDGQTDRVAAKGRGRGTGREMCSTRIVRKWTKKDRKTDSRRRRWWCEQEQRSAAKHATVVTLQPRPQPRPLTAQCNGETRGAIKGYTHSERRNAIYFVYKIHQLKIKSATKMPKPKGGQEKENAANMALEMFFSLARGATNSRNQRYSERKRERKREIERARQ